MKYFKLENDKGQAELEDKLHAGKISLSVWKKGKCNIQFPALIGLKGDFKFSFSGTVGSSCNVPVTRKAKHGKYSKRTKDSLGSNFLSSILFYRCKL